jgi:hypothetical protein
MSISGGLLKIENVFDHKLANAITTGTKIIVAVTTELQKLDVAVDSALPKIEAIAGNPIFEVIKADFATAAIGTEIISILNRYQNFIHAAATDPQILRGLQQKAVAEMTSVIHGVQKKIDEYFVHVINFFAAMGL